MNGQRYVVYGFINIIAREGLKISVFSFLKTVENLPRKKRLRQRELDPASVSEDEFVVNSDVDEEGNRVFRCPKCPAVFKQSYNVKRHLKMCGVEDRPKNHKCTVCGQTFYDIFSLRGHMKRKCGMGEKKTPCELCGKVFWDKGSLNSHLKNQHNPEEVICEHCGKRLYRHSLNAHLRKNCPKLHSKEKQTCHIYNEKTKQMELILKLFFFLGMPRLRRK